MQTQRKRVVVTGMGLMSSIADNVDEFKEALFNKVCGIRPSEHYQPWFDGANASEVLREVVYEDLPAERAELLDKAALWAYKVGHEALKRANASSAELREKTGLVIGISSAGTEAYMPILEENYEIFSLKKIVVSGSFASPSAIVSALLGLKGGFEMVATACTASTNAIGMAFDQIQNGKNPAVLVIGTEPLYLPTFAGFYALHAMKRGPASPFSGEPGMSIGEGAGALMLEEYEHAVARGAKIYAEIVAYATSGDAFHETAPDPRAEGAVQVMRSALNNAGLQPHDIQYINAHGTGTDANDRSETLAMKKVFSTIADIPVSSTKAYVGHNIGSAGIIELIACYLTLPEKKILPTLNFTVPRPNCDLNYVPNEFQSADVGVFMKNNYAFGGNNCCVISSTRAGIVPATSYEPKRVGITGMGAVASAGHDLDEIFDVVWSGKPSGRKVKLTGEVKESHSFAGLVDHPSVREKVKQYLLNIFSPEIVNSLGERYIWVHTVDNLDPRKYLRRFDERKADPICTFALLALTQALKGASRKIRRDGHDLGLVLGMSKGPRTSVETYMRSMIPEPTKVRTSEFPGALMNAIATFCSITEGIKGYNTTLATGNNAAFGALGYAYELVRQNLQPQVIAGGADERPMQFWSYLQTLNDGMQLEDHPEAYEVYGENGKGYLLGEGAGMLFLEDVEHARARGVEVLAEILGYGRACDAAYFDRDAIEPRCASITTSIRHALDEAGIGIDEIDLVCGNSDGTATNNAAELGAIRAVLGERVGQVPVVNYNGYFGNVESCSAMLNMIVVLEIMRRGEIPPIPYTTTFSADDIQFVTSLQRKQVRTALVLGATEGGNHYAYVIRAGA
ncbi:beta-ketoacyl-[acyl-carrier-protein] synthase family protein [Paraburkholderia oxyphila]|uniref:beta-ketoacyl-[acyl-carrier-protein] synthase family protein n=1 Tax=Paraburkholderia oxyphila TaxID=614212 RepID=UPI000484C2F0|nr:beta-ketoacyl-[acyl-carrier-protein] synthase family protein [Paraburkholderia oxyphila]